MILASGESTLKDWVKEVGMSGRCQSALIAAMRGADADDSPEVKRLVRWVRKQTIKNNNPKSHFMKDWDFINVRALIQQDAWQWDRLNSDFYDHIKQAMEILGYFHPDEMVASKSLEAYTDLQKHESMNVESKAELILRLKDTVPVARGEWVTQDWLLELSGRCQTSLLCSLRTSDAICADEEIYRITRWLRSVTMKNVMPASHYMADKEFMRIKSRLEMYPMSWGNIPIHFRHHTREALEIVGYLHPDAAVRSRALTAYEDICLLAKGKPESKDELIGRMQDKPGNVFEMSVQRTNLPQ